MALILADRVRETTSTTGTGTITLSGAVTGYQSFSAVGNGNTTYYCIAGQGTTEWEVGIGTYTSAGTTLSRDTVLSSSNSGSKVVFSAGTKDVFVTYPSGKSINQDASGNTYVPNLGASTASAGTFTTLIANSTFQAGKGSANYIQGVGAATTLEPVISVIGSDTNVPLAIRTQGTGAIDLAPGSSGVNISNGGTVTALTISAAGSAYTSAPSISITAPTTAGGVQATASLTLRNTGTPTIVSGGTGYTVSDVLTVSGGTSTSAVSVTVATVSAGVITSVTATNQGSYTVLPTNPVSVTGGTGTGATFNLNFIVNTLTITAAGSGYVEQPTVSFSGGGGSGAAAYATVGGATFIKGLGTNFDIFTAAANRAFRFYDSNSTGSNFWSASNGTTPVLYATGASNTSAAIITNGTGSLSFQSSGGSATQAVIAHTASAVNYVQVTGSPTSPGVGSVPTISVQGSDSTTYLGIGIKGTGGYVSFYNNGAPGSGTTMFRVKSTTGTLANYVAVTPAIANSAPIISADGSDTNLGLNVQSKGTGAINLQTAGGTTQLAVADTASAVNYVQVTGNITGSRPIISSQGSDSNIGLSLYSKGNRSITLYTNNVTALDALSPASSVNYFSIAGSITTIAPVLSVTGSDTNISQVFQPKGTGAIDLAAGSSGVNISNGGTVTAITRTASGSGYTSLPSIAIAAPTTAGGVQATASLTMFVGTATVSAGGSGYLVGDVLTISGGTSSIAATLTVATLSGSAVATVTVSNNGSYTALPTNPVSVTGGTGTGATFTLTWGVGSSFTITNAGSGYVEQPTVSFSGGGGSGAAAYATVGGTPVIKGLGLNLSFANSNGTALTLVDGGVATPNSLNVRNAGNLNVYPATGTFILSGGTGSNGVNIYSNQSSNLQLAVAHTASAVNYVQVTGAATTAAPVISVQGSDTNIAIGLTSKGTSAINLLTNNGNQRQLQITHTASAVNYVAVTGAAANAAPAISVAGTDTNIDLALQAKGTGYVKVNAGTGLGYGTGVGGAVTQATSRTTGVTLNFPCGAITLVSAAGTTSWQTFTVTNSAVAATDTIVVKQKSGTDLYQIFVTNIAAGSFKITFATTGGTSTEQPVFNFAVLKAVAA